MQNPDVCMLAAAAILKYIDYRLTSFTMHSCISVSLIRPFSWDKDKNKYFFLFYLSLIQGRSQKFVSEGDKPGNWGHKSPSRVRRQNPGEGLGMKPPEAEE